MQPLSMRLKLALLWAAALVAWAVDDARAAQPSAKRPNFIFILLDDQGWGDASAFGHPYMRTPNIDRIVREGTWFTQFYVANPVCSPSRTAFMTGQYPARLRIHEHLATHEMNQARGMPDWLDPDVVTVAKLLKQAGYATAHFGKWHLGNGPDAPPPQAYGIDDAKCVNANSNAWDESKQPYFRARSTGLFVDETIRFIKEHREQPFYVNLWTLVPHAKLQPTDEELARYAELLAKPDDFPSWMRDYVAQAKSPTEQMRVFCAAMSGLDSAIGRLLEFLDAEGLADSTAIVMSSDNGPEDYHIGNAANAGIGWPGVFRGRKRSLYEGGLRVPLVVRWPGHVPAGRRDDDALLASVDFLPTVCKLAGVSENTGTPDGEDASDILLGSSRQRTKPICWQWCGNVAGDAAYRPPRLAIRDGKWKLFVEMDGSSPQLYDIPADPEERHDLASQQPDVVQRFSTLAVAWSKTLPAAPLLDEPAGKKRSAKAPQAADRSSAN